jgi:hypothetical protein
MIEALVFERSPKEEPCATGPSSPFSCSRFVLHVCLLRTPEPSSVRTSATRICRIPTSSPDFSNNIIAVPGSEEWGQPGFRVGYLSPKGRWDVNVDLGFVHRSGPIFEDMTTFDLYPQLQYNFPSEGFSPFINGGIGIHHESALGLDLSSSRPIFGVGAGLRKPVSNAHGFIRGEVRYDHIPDDEEEISPGNVFTFPTTDLLSVKLGFDLGPEPLRWASGSRGLAALRSRPPRASGPAQKG